MNRLLLTFALAAAAPAASADWKAEADARIAEHRQSTLQVRVVDGAGRAVEGAEVSVDMQAHAFGWGTAVNARTWTDPDTDARYRQNVLKYFNRATIENGLKMKHWENADFRADTTNTIEDLFDAGLGVRGHALVWQDSGTPEDVRTSTDKDHVRNRVNDHIRDLASHSFEGGTIDEWDVVNENYAQHNLIDLFRGANQGFDDHPLLGRWVEKAADAAPDARHYVNDYHILTYDTNWSRTHRDSFFTTAESVSDAGAPLGGVGFQSHVNGAAARITPEQMVERMNAFAAIDEDLRLAVTEFDVRGDDWTTAEKVDYVEQFTTLAFAQEQMEHFTLWGFWDGRHPHGSALLFDEDWDLKEEGEAWIDLVYGQWWTQEDGTTDTAGLFSTEAFHGEHDLTVTADGVSRSLRVDLLDSGVFTVVMPEPSSAFLLLPAAAMLCRRRR